MLSSYASLNRRLDERTFVGTLLDREIKLPPRKQPRLGSRKKAKARKHGLIRLKVDLSYESDGSYIYERW